jgi:CMP-N-acetylneuraminic acid synthetase
MRPDELASNHAAKLPAIRHAVIQCESIYNEKYSIVLDLDPTAPIRKINDLDNCLFQFQKGNYDTLFSVVEAHKNPYFNMVEKNKDDFYELCKDSVSLTRQSAPQVLELNASFYWYKEIYFEMDFNSAITNKSLAYIMDHICFDLDHPIDFDFMEYILKNNKLDFNFI